MSDVIDYPKLYKTDSGGKVRLWFCQRQDDQIRTCAGQLDGKMVISEWKKRFGKNVGRTNSTDGDTQADSEIQSLYTKQREIKGYTDDIGLASVGPAYTEPMLAQKYGDVVWADIAHKGPLVVQPKLDGVRCIASYNGLFSRKGKRIVAVPHIAMLLESIWESFPNLQLDGELYNHNLKDDFNEIISNVRKTKPTAEDIEASSRLIEYHIYDIVSDQSYQQRYETIQEVVRQVNDPRIVAVPSLTVTAKSQIVNEFGAFVDAGYEGLMLRTNSPYEVGKRSKNLLKYKEFSDAEYVILDIHQGEGNWQGVAKTMEFATETGARFRSTIKGSRGQAKQIWDSRDQIIGNVATVKFVNLTPDGIPRHSNVVAFYGKERDM